MRPLLACALALLLVAPFATPASARAPAPLGDEEGKKGEREEAPPEIPPPPRDNTKLPPGLPAEVEKEFAEALDLYEKAGAKFRDEGLRKDAVRAMTRLKSKVPSGQPLYYLGILHQWDEDYRKARKALEELIAASATSRCGRRSPRRRSATTGARSRSTRTSSTGSTG
jgi:hypothetical protein